MIGVVRRRHRFRRPASRRHPDGRAINLADGVIRLSRAPVTPNPTGSARTSGVRRAETAYELCLDLQATAATLLPGHRIRIDVTSSSYPPLDPA